jgi:hypothetical protein
LLKSNGTNVLIADLQLSDANRSVITAEPGPNVDTLYAGAVFDLSTSDLIVTVPKVDAGRYWSLDFYSPYVTTNSGRYQAN